MYSFTRSDFVASYARIDQARFCVIRVSEQICSELL